MGVGSLFTTVKGYPTSGNCPSAQERRSVQEISSRKLLPACWRDGDDCSMDRKELAKSPKPGSVFKNFGLDFDGSGLWDLRQHGTNFSTPPASENKVSPSFLPQLERKP